MDTKIIRTYQTIIMNIGGQRKLHKKFCESKN